MFPLPNSSLTESEAETYYPIFFRYLVKSTISVSTSKTKSAILAPSPYQFVFISNFLINLNPDLLNCSTPSLTGISPPYHLVQSFPTYGHRDFGPFLSKGIQLYCIITLKPDTLFLLHMSFFQNLPTPIEDLPVTGPLSLPVFVRFFHRFQSADPLPLPVHNGMNPLMLPTKNCLFLFVAHKTARPRT